MKSEGQKPTSYTSDLRNTKAKLPWWVEILFVQIGLPENLLRKILKIKNRSSNHLNKYKKSYFISTLILASFIYIDPVIRYANNTNYCVRETLDYLSNKNLEKTDKKGSKKAIAINYCNGGSYLIFD